MQPDPTPAEHPQTKAGRAMWAAFNDPDPSWIDDGEEILRGILAIEAEAAQGAAPLDAVNLPDDAGPKDVEWFKRGWMARERWEGAAPRAEGLDDLIERARDYRYSDEWLGASLRRLLSRPSDERVPESEER